MNNLFKFLLCLIFLANNNFLMAEKLIFSQANKIIVHTTDTTKSNPVTKAFDRFGIIYETTDSLNPENNSYLHIICNIFDIKPNSLPKYYVVYQDSALQNISQEYIKKLQQAVVVWDASWENINRYRWQVPTYYFFPPDYEYTDPVILPCLLPTACLNTYKEILTYSNNNNTDIASHLPTIFCYSILQNPDLIIEAGVRGGESTIAFAKAMNFLQSKLIGIDIEQAPANAYSNVKDGMFLCMDDLDFSRYYAENSNLNKRKIDIIFIDTSHYYVHTFNEIASFAPLLASKGFLLFHDSYMSPLPNYQWYCINGTVFGHGWDNERGVTRAIKNYFSIDFDETRYNNFEFTKNGIIWHMIHHPFCNGFTLIQKV